MLNARNTRLGLFSRAVENTDTTILDGQRIYYNHVRPHQALGGKTPAEAAGIAVKGKNK